ncbi:hypothetical protein PRIC2_006289 [Phytophthora ramorum]
MDLSGSDKAEQTHVSVDIVVRQFRAEDLPQVVEIFKAGMRSYDAFRALSEHTDVYLQESLDGDLSDIHGTYIAPGGNFWVATSATDPTEVAGIVGLEPKDNKEGELRRMSVKDFYRRCGVGRKLIAALEQWARENGIRKVWLTTGGPMDKARQFYPSVGYEQTAVTVVSEDPYFEVYTFGRRTREQVVTLFKDGMMHYPAHKVNAEVLEQHMNEAVTTGDLSSIEATYITPGGNFWVATPRTKPADVVGMVALEVQDGNVGELRRMSVKENYRRHGVGRILVVALEEWAQEHGFRKVWLGTGAVMDTARAFYTSMDYGQTKTVVISEDPLVEGVLFEKDLSNAAIA